MRYRLHLSCLYGCLLAFAGLALPAHGQTTAPNEWTWMGGSSRITDSDNGEYGEPGVYGVLGVPSGQNIPGGRLGAVSWTDAGGNFWLFGGSGFDSVETFGFLNDLWKFDPTSNEWTWMAGGSIIEAENEGQPGIYGVLGTAAPGNIPGGRSGALGWTDASGNFWLFGGAGFDSVGAMGDLNDLWEFNVASGEWAWMGGSATLPGAGSVAGIYGTLGSFSAGNYPGSRNKAATWTDRSGNLWLFGGNGEDSLNQHGDLNDLWEFVPSTGEWAWMGGSSTLPGDGLGTPGVYGQRGTAAAGNIPGGREGSATWTDSNGNLWLFGGFGFEAVAGGTSTNGFLNDLWRFTPGSHQWTWMGGNSNFPSSCVTDCGWPGIYGPIGVPSATEMPGSRVSAVVWTDQDGNLWLFGGEGQDSSGHQNTFLNDLWEFNPSTNQWAWISGSDGSGTLGKPGIYGTLGTPAPSNIPGGRESCVSWIDHTGDLWLMAGSGNAKEGSGFLNDLWEYEPVADGTTPSFTLAVTPAAVSVAQGGSSASTVATSTTGGFNSAISLSAVGQPTAVTVTFTPASIAGAGSSTMNIVVGSGVAAGTYPITVTGISGSITQTATVTLTVMALTPAATPAFTPPAGTYNSAQSVSITDATANASIYYTADGTTPTANSTLYAGAITVGATETIKAIAVAPSYSTSAVASATYTIPPDFTLTLNPTAITVRAGMSGVLTVTAVGIGGLNPNLSYACSGLPSGAACTFTPQGLPTPLDTNSTTLTVTTAEGAAVRNRSEQSLLPAAALAAILCCVGWRRYRRIRALTLLAFCAIGFSALSGCGVVYTPHPVTSTVTVTGTTGSLQHKATFSLTVN